MTLQEAIARMLKLREKYGDVELFFDCPKCQQSFTPNVCVPSITMHADKEPVK